MPAQALAPLFVAGIFALAMITMLDAALFMVEQRTTAIVQ
jgi:hypothetical protein